jgi:hypothetical protein
MPLALAGQAEWALQDPIGLPLWVSQDKIDKSPCRRSREGPLIPGGL